jgi:nanoRNase/pAp phosphatase (c-di-AMP/oligoRNAs hydrolase)
MTKKVESKREEFLINIKKISELIGKYDKFFFYFSPDPDASGISVAFSLFLKQKNKDAFIYLPEGVDSNLDFLFDIATYNDIIILKKSEDVEKMIEKESPVFVVCDTPTRFLLPEFKKLTKLKDKYSPAESIEIDHHFGGDSEQIFEKSITLFSAANSCSEIFADYLMETEDDFEKSFPRNIVLSLLVGICFDTQFGKFLDDKINYDKWFGFLSERIKNITWDGSNLKSSEQIFDAINRISEAKESVLNYLTKSTDAKDGVGLLVVPEVGMYESLSPNGDSTCILSKVVSDLSNMVPEVSGKIGLLAFYNDSTELYYIKVRRSFVFKEYDLRLIEDILADVFGKNFIGGGGHPGAVSFRMNADNRKDFIKKAEIVRNKIVEAIKL